MIGSLVALISLNMTVALYNAGQTAGQFALTGATATTPVVITVPNHGVPLGRYVDGVLNDLPSMPEINGAVWRATPLDSNTFALATYTAAGVYTPSAGVNAYGGGGYLTYTFPDWGILLGRRNVALSTAVASPRIVMVPSTARAVGFEPYVAQGQAYQQRGTTEQALMKQLAQAGTDFTTFEVYFTASANPPSPDFGDFDAAQVLAWTFYNMVWDLVGDAIDIKSAHWTSQLPANHPLATGTQTQRGQQLLWIAEFQQPITVAPLSFVPRGTSLVESVYPVNAGSGDTTTITIPNSSPT